MIHWRSETVAPSSRWIVGSAMLTTVLSSIAIARAKHIVSRTIVFSRALSPLKPSSGMSQVLSARPIRQRPMGRVCSLGQLLIQADRERDEDRQDGHDPDRRE